MQEKKSQGERFLGDKGGLGAGSFTSRSLPGKEHEEFVGRRKESDVSEKKEVGTKREQ